MAKRTTTILPEISYSRQLTVIGSVGFSWSWGKGFFKVGHFEAAKKIMRSLLLASALSIGFSHDASSLGGGGGGGGGAPQPSSPTPPAPQINNLLNFGNSAISAILIGPGKTLDLEQVFGRETYQDSINLICENCGGRVAAQSRYVRHLIAAYTLWQRGIIPPDDNGPGGYGNSTVFTSRAGYDFDKIGAVIIGDLQAAFSILFGYSVDELYKEDESSSRQVESIINSEAYRKRRDGSFPPLGSLPFAPERNTSILPEDVALAYAQLVKDRSPATARLPPFVQRWTTWESFTGGYNATSANAANNTPASTLRAYVGMVGAEYQYAKDLQFGLAMGGVGSNWGQSGGSGRGETFQFAVYGKKFYGPAYFAGWLDVTNSWFNSNRFAANGDAVTSNFTTQSYGGRIEGGYRYVAAMLGITPYASLQLQYLHTPGYGENDLNGGGQGVSYVAKNATDTRSELGMRFDIVAFVENRTLTLTASAAWAHDWYSDSTVSGVFQTLPGAGFTIASGVRPQDSALAAFEAKIPLTNGWSVVGRFDGQFANTSQSYAGTGTLNYKW
ncbi:MAG: autotransporter outer membrane beta-barrel domain-containing protein [Pseudomonadota bacterium]